MELHWHSNIPIQGRGKGAIGYTTLDLTRMPHPQVYQELACTSISERIRVDNLISLI